MSLDLRSSPHRNAGGGVSGSFTLLTVNHLAVPNFHLIGIGLPAKLPPIFLLLDTNVAFLVADRQRPRHKRMPCRFCHRLFRCFVEWLVARNAYWLGSLPFTPLLEIYLFISATPHSQNRLIPFLFTIIIYPRPLNTLNLFFTFSF